MLDRQLISRLSIIGLNKDYNFGISDSGPIDKIINNDSLLVFITGSRTIEFILISLLKKEFVLPLLWRFKNSYFVDRTLTKRSKNIQKPDEFTKLAGLFLAVFHLL